MCGLAMMILTGCFQKTYSLDEVAMIYQDVIDASNEVQRLQKTLNRAYLEKKLLSQIKKINQAKEKCHLKINEYNLAVDSLTKSDLALLETEAKLNLNLCEFSPQP